MLLTRPGSCWARVTTVHRREVELPEDLKAHASRLQQVVSPDLASAMENFGDERVAAAFARADCVFCALGTTRKVRGWQWWRWAWGRQRPWQGRLPQGGIASPAV